jgi:DNA-binding response OmpR family regulator
MLGNAAKHVLVAEDERPLAHALELKLTKEGYQVTLAKNGQECLELVAQGGFDVLLLDLMMPVVDGFKVLEQLQSVADRPVTFVLSNLSQQEDETKALSLGASKFFIKSNTPLAVIVAEVKAASGT